MSYSGPKAFLPLGEDGLYGPRRVPITGLIRARGLTFENNQLEKEGGARRMNTSALPGRLVALKDWAPYEGASRVVAITDAGGVHVDDGLAWSFPMQPLANGTLATAASPPLLIEAGQEAPGNPRRLFVYTGRNPVYHGTGDLTDVAALDPSLTPLDWVGSRQPRGGVVHEGRHWAWLDHTLYYTTPTDHRNFLGGGILPIAPGEGEAITVCASFRKMLIVFKKPRGVYVVDTSAFDPDEWRYDILSRAVGCPSVLGVCHIPNDLLFINTEGSLHALSATAVERDAEASDITTGKLGTWIREHVDPEALHWASLVWYGDKSQAHVLLPGIGYVTRTSAAFQADAFQTDAFQQGSATPTGPSVYRLVVDFNNPAVGPRYCYSDRDSATVLTLRRVRGVERPFIGTDDGLIYKLDEPQRNKDGVGYIGEWQTDHSDLGDAVPEWKGRAKNFDYLELWLEGVGPYHLHVDVYVDGVKKTDIPGVDHLHFSMAGRGVPLGTFVLGVDRLGEPGVTKVRHRLPWRGTRISFRGFNDGANETFKITHAFVGAKVAE